MRIKQWPKNGLIVLAAIFAHTLDDLATIERVFLAFFAFSLTASAIYIVNDCLDRKQDRLHPRKRFRPIAAGTLSVHLALLIAALCIIGAGAITAFLALGPLYTRLPLGVDPFSNLGGSAFLFAVALCSYVALNISYSTWLKRLVLWDVISIASGFVLRAVAGALAAAVVISPWFYLCTIFLSLFLALGKRRAELAHVEQSVPSGGTRKSLQHYTLQLLDQLMMLAVICAVITYSLYTFQGVDTHQKLMLTIPFVIFGVCRYLYLVYAKAEGEHPDELLWQDKQLLACVLLCTLIVFVLLYIPMRAEQVKFAASFLVVNLIVLIGAYAAFCCFQIKGTISAMLTIFVCFIAQIIISLLLAGVVFQHLLASWVFVINLVISTLLVVLAWRWKRLFLPPLPTLEQRARQLSSDLFHALICNPWLLVVSLLTTVEVAWIIFLAILYPPYSWDGLAYHLPTVVAWIQTGRIGTVPYGVIWSNTYPANTELVFTWLVLFLHDPVLVDLGEFVFALGGMLAVMGLGRSLGLRRPSAFIAGCLFFLTPVVLVQAESNYVDLALASMFLVFFYLLWRSLEEQKIALLALAGIAGGITLGIKSSAAAYIGISLLVLSMVALARHRVVIWRKPLRSFRKIVGFLLILGMPILLLGTYWYIHTWVVYGNPIYPVTFQLLGHTFPGTGTVDSLIMVGETPQILVGHPWWQQIFLSWMNDPAPRDSIGICLWKQQQCAAYLTGPYNYDIRVGGFGPQWTYLEFPLLVFLTGYALLRQRKIFWMLILPFVLIFLVQPDNWWSRYAIFFVALGVLALVFVIERLPRWWLRVPIQIACLALLLFSLYWSSLHLYFSPLVVKQAFTLPPQQRTIGNLWFPQYAWVDRLPQGVRIGFSYSGDLWGVYPLFGTDLKNQAILLQSTTEQDFLDELRTDGIQYVAAGADSDYARWADADPAHFHLIDSYADQWGSIQVYQVNL